jgi:hypothetical protein
MFGLTATDLSGEILDCAGGPASFNAEASARGLRVVSCDPLYEFSAGDISERINATFDQIVSNAEANRDRFLWHEIESPQRLGEVRMRAMRCFLEDFSQGLEAGRYRAAALPSLPFEDHAFDLALCSHFLFTYSDQLSMDFHVAAIEEMCRVAREARVFPLLESYGGTSPLLEPVISTLRQRGYAVQTRLVPYEFQRGGNRMLVASHRLTESSGA